MDYISLISIFVMTGYFGCYVVWSVKPTRHPPLMFGNKAISSGIFVGALILSAPTSLAHGQEATQSNYRFPWVAIPNPDPVTVTIAEKRWAPVIAFRPAQTLVLDHSVVELGKTDVRIAAGTFMLAMDNTARVVCELTRPKGQYFIGCIEDRDGDGRHESLFLLNHANPFLFSAVRQPRHQKNRQIEPVAVRVTKDNDAKVSMVFHFRSHSSMSGTSQYELCVMRDDVSNIWGDKSVARGCLPIISVKDGATPQILRLYGRQFRFAPPVAGSATLTVSAQANPVSVEL